MKKIEFLGSVLYKIISFIGLVLGFVILYFMFEMFLMVLATEPNLDSAFKAYFEWVYLNISIVSVFLIRNKTLICVLITLIVMFYFIFKRKWGKENVLFLIAEFYFLYVPTYLENYLNKTGIKLLDFVFTDLGVYVNLFTILVFSFLLVISVKEMKKANHNKASTGMVV